MQYLEGIQTEAGTFKGTEQDPALEHGIVTVALCEAWSMTRRPQFKTAAEKAVSVIVRTQRPSGFWGSGLDADKGSDNIEASVWLARALRGARMAGVMDEEVRPASQRAAEAFKTTIEPDIAGRKTGPATATLQRLGFGRHPACRAGLKALEGLTMNWDQPAFENPVFQWHHISEAKFNEGGNAWRDWNKSFSRLLISKQTIEEEEGKKARGYWVSPGQGEYYGRIYSTALCCMMLEVYYAYLPFRNPPDENGGASTNAPAKEVKIEIKM
jgi:hypothetical protein